ncbi:hypothetical protein EDEG_01877 [Edhazardia aedis USNM 41457]|uniref:Uncharacterized protein n=1 Tax=Edhazardia aedis (strain USNM 41457) TaxID=1003232 RepID=J8ZVY3_EDHAE|nr:hypothetical protein EDEG_01877 [Edhazardia aedis USNM 41457]|eukprot:EJW03833.1 hypothetical protein EDEG_01877 [Edhazardia aedis USNM 41457]
MSESKSMKTRYAINLYHVSGFSFTVFNPQNVDNLKTLNANKTYQLLKKILVEKADINVFRGVNNDSHIFIDRIGLIEEDDDVCPAFVLQKGFRFFKRIMVPPCLYLMKNDLVSEISKISKKNNVDIELNISHDVSIYLGGSVDNLFPGISETYKMIEKMFERDVMVLNGYYLIEDIRRFSNVGVYPISRINCKDILITGRRTVINEIAKKLNSNEYLFKRSFHADSYKFLYLIYYKRLVIENLLCERECYLIFNNEDLKFSSEIEVTIKGFYDVNIKKCIKNIKDLFQETIKVIYYEKKPRPHTFKIFHFRISDDNGNNSSDHCFDKKNIKYDFSTENIITSNSNSDSDNTYSSYGNFNFSGKSDTSNKSSAVESSNSSYEKDSSKNLHSNVHQSDNDQSYKQRFGDYLFNNNIIDNKSEKKDNTCTCIYKISSNETMQNDTFKGELDHRYVEKKYTCACKDINISYKNSENNSNVNLDMQHTEIIDNKKSVLNSDNVEKNIYLVKKYFIN